MKVISRSTLLAIVGLAVLTHCGSSPPVTTPADPAPEVQPVIADDSSSAINRLLVLAADADSPQAEDYILQASAIALENEDADNAAAILSGLDVNDLPLRLRVSAGLQRMKLALLRNDAQNALIIANGSPFDRVTDLSAQARLELMELRSEAYLELEQYLAAAREHTRMAELITNTDRLTENNNRIWQILTTAPAGRLGSQMAMVDSYELRGWMELIDVVNNNQNNIERQVEAITRWQNRWNRHSAAATLPDALAFAVNLLNNRPARVALMLPLGDAAGRAVNEGFMAAYYDAVSQNQHVPEVEVIDTTNIVDVGPLYQAAIERGVDMIIGPLRKESVRQLQNMESLSIPTLALNYGDEGRINPRGFYQFGLAPEDEIRQAARMAWQAGHRYAAVLTPAGQDYRRIQDAFIQYWQELGGEVVAQANFDNASGYSDVIRRLMSIDNSEARARQLQSVLPRSSVQFTPRRRQDIDFVFMLANPAEGRLLKPTMAFHFVGDVPVYAMPAIYDGSSDPASNRDLNGIMFVDAPWVLGSDDPLLRTTQDIWPNAAGPVQRLRAMGVDSFRLHTRIAQLANFPGIRIQGATGVLSMRSDGSIMRELIGARFDEGAITIIQPDTLPSEVAGN